MKFKEISSIFLHFGAEGNIGTSILPRRKGKKIPKELENQTNKPETQVKNRKALAAEDTLPLLQSS